MSRPRPRTLGGFLVAGTVLGAATLCPRNAGAHGALGDVYVAAGRFRDAEASYRRALEVDAGFVPAHAGLGDVARRFAAHEVVDHAGVARCLGGGGMRARGAEAVPVPAARLAVRILFAEGSAELDARAKAQLDEIASALRTDLGSTRFVVEGHADAGEGKGASLSATRAERVRAYLAATDGVATDRLVSRSYGAAWPVATGDSTAARAVNRRVELVRASADDPSPPREPLRVEAQVLEENAGGRLVPLARGAALESGARYAVRLSSPDAVHAYVIQEDATGQVTRLFPNPASGAGRNPLTAKVDLVLPGGGRLFRLDETVGRERVYVVATRSAARDIEDLMARAEAAGKRPQQHEMVLRIQSRGVAGLMGPEADLPALAQSLPGDDDAALTVIEFEHRPRPGGAVSRTP